MRHQKGKNVFCLGLATLLFAGAGSIFFDTLTHRGRVSAAETPIIIDAGSNQPYTVPQDSSGKVESNIAEGFVQADVYKPNLKKISINSYSVPVYSSIQQSFQLDDGTYLSVLMVDNQSASGAPYRIATDFIIRTDLDGNILASKSIPKNTVGLDVNMTATSGNLGEYSRYFTGKKIDGSSVMLFYSGQKPGDTSTENRAVLVDSNLNLTYYDIATGTYVPQETVEGFGYVKYTDEIVNIGFMHGATQNQTSFEVYTVGSNGIYSNKRQFTAPEFASVLPGTKTSGWMYVLRNNSLAANAAGNYAGIVQAYDVRNGVEVNGYAVVLWDSNGNILAEYPLAYQNSLPMVQPSITAGNDYYYLENDSNNVAAYLKKMDMQTGAITTVQQFPYGTRIQVKQPNVADLTYNFYGSITDASGIFSGYAPAGTGGAITGTLESDFSLLNASVVSANGTINQTESIEATDPYFFVGGATNATDFSKEPANGWQNQTQFSNNRYGNAYFGSMALIHDYAPAIDVGAPTVINMDTVTDWDAALLAGVQVIDTYDLNPDEGNRTQDWLNERVNRNPFAPNAAYDWNALGLDTSTIGLNRVTYFITDSSMQTTASSKIVNVIADTTEYDTNQTLALDAHNFIMPLADAASLTQEQAKDNSHGNVQAWNMNNGSDLLAGVSVNQAEYQAIVNATKVGSYPLTFSVTENGVTVNNTIIVSLIDDNTVVDTERGEAIYAHDFTIEKSAVAGLTDQTVIQNAAAIAWNLDSGEYLALTPEYAQVIAQIGVHPANFSTAAGTQKAINVTVIDDSINSDNNNNSGGLPVTGEYLLEIALLGLAGIAAGMFIILKRRKE